MEELKKKIAELEEELKKEKSKHELANIFGNLVHRLLSIAFNKKFTKFTK